MIWSSILLSADLRLRPIWRALLFLPLFVLLAIPIVIVSTLVAGPDRVQDNLEVGFIVQGVVLTAAPLLAGWILLRLLDRRSFRTLGLWFYDGWGRELLWGLAGGLGLMSVLVGALVALGQVHLSFASLDARSVLLGLGWNVVVFFGAAAGEEILFRGYPFQRLVESWGAFAAVFVLSALFGWGHLSNPSATPLSTANTVLMGILLALAYLKTRALWFPIGLHFSWNFVMAAVYSLPVSGIVVQRQLLVATISGPDWLSGGNYGPEGSVLTTAVALLAILWLVRTHRLRVSPAQAKEVELARAGGEP